MKKTITLKKYDCIIVGAGPAGIFAALEFAKHNKLKILLLEKGNPLEKRMCQTARNGGVCVNCKVCDKTKGWGGGGALSDGKLNVATSTVGVRVLDYMSKSDFIRLVNAADKLWVKFGAPENLFGTNNAEIRKIKKLCNKAKLDFKVSPIRHIGTGRSFDVLNNMYNALKSRIEIRFNSEVEEILVDDNKAVGVKLKNSEKYFTNNVIVAPGREGNAWFAKECKKLGLDKVVHPVELGVRVEVPAEVMKKLTDILYEAKISYEGKTFNDFVRTFCMCPNGFVTRERINVGSSSIISANGHSFSDRKSENTNFAILVRSNFTAPFKEPNLYGTYVTGLSNLISNGVLVQRLGDLLAGRRSTPERIKTGRVKPTLADADPGDLAFALPYRHLVNILEMLRALDNVAPGVFSFDTLLYGTEVKFFSSGPVLKKYLETQIDNLYACGDGVGVSANLVHASVSGLLVAEHIVNKIKKKGK